MSHEVFEIIRNMDLSDIEVQMALQCAPFISGLKVSNLFIVHDEHLDYLISLLNEMNITWKILFHGKKKTTLLLYKAELLRRYFSDVRVKALMVEAGYKREIVDDEDIEMLMEIFCSRYQRDMKTKRQFPHEMGLFLGYPVEDVEGYLNNNGENSLYTGYWKVYENLDEKFRLFKSFEAAKENIIRFLAQGVSIKNIAEAVQ